MAKKTKKTVMGSDIVALLLSCSSYPAHRTTEPYARKLGYDHMRFRLAMVDMWWGKWNASEFRDPMCQTIMRNGVTWPQLQSEKRKLERKAEKEREKKLQQEESPQQEAGAARKRMSRESIATINGVSLAGLMMECGGLCPVCGVDMIAGYNYHLDHIMPLALGGSNDLHNIWFICRRCNSRKHYKNPYDWSRDVGAVLPARFHEKYG